MKKTTIFLASSSELASDRDQFEIFIGRKNKTLVGRQVFLDLVRWEDFLDAMSQTRLQDEYNKAISHCDIFIMLFFTKVGQYTQEEFEHAFKQFKETNKPFIFTYFKDAPVSMADIDDSVLSLIQFKKKLKELGHFFTVYKNIEELILKFDGQINKLIENEFIKFDKEDTVVPNTITINQHSSGSGDNVAGDKTVNYKS
jgi:hypothetical protein